jgi:hypothetical protein
MAREYWQKARNTGGKREILADSKGILADTRNTSGWREILADRKKYWRITEKYSRISEK